MVGQTHRHCGSRGGRTGTSLSTFCCTNQQPQISAPRVGVSMEAARGAQSGGMWCLQTARVVEIMLPL